MKMYAELAGWWPLLSPPEEYAEEAAFYRTVLESASDLEPRTLLEIGSGGGNNASFLKGRFEMTLVDASPEMLDVSRSLNPECEHLPGDMRDVRLGRRFDRVFIHDAICYMTTEEDLRRTIVTAFEHCEPGGAILLGPDFIRETFRTGTDHGGSDGERRALRYLEWVTDPDPTDTVYTVDYVLMLRGEDGRVEVEHDRHLEGLFPRATWLRLMREAGLEARAVPFPQPDGSPHQLEVFVGVRPSR